MHTEYQSSSGKYNAEDSRRKTNWGLVGNKHAMTLRHTDVMGTAAVAQSGEKIWAVGTPINLTLNGRGDWGSRHALSDWEPTGAGTEYLRWEFTLQEPGTIL